MTEIEMEEQLFPIFPFTFDEPEDDTRFDFLSDELYQREMEEDSGIRLENSESGENQTEQLTSTTTDSDVKTELPDHDLLPFQQSSYVYKCRICDLMCTSRYSFTLHVNKHEKKCSKCNLTFETWKNLENHEPFCSSRFGRILISPRVYIRNEQPKSTPYKCSLCKRKYSEFKHLYRHQVNTCKKRYISSSWVVKI